MEYRLSVDLFFLVCLGCLGLLQHELDWHFVDNDDFDGDFLDDLNRHLFDDWDLDVDWLLD